MDRNMILLCPVGRRSACYVMGGILTEAIRRGDAILGWMPPGTAKTPADQVTPNEIWAQWPGLHLLYERHKIPSHAIWVAPAGEAPPISIPAVQIDYVWDLLHQAPQRDVALAFTTALQRTLYERCWGSLPAHAIIGSPMLPPLSQQTSPSTLIYFLPKFKPGWRRWTTRVAAWQVLYAAHRAARRWGFEFVVKTRDKHGWLPGVTRLADAVIRDRQDGILWPSPTQRLLTNAALVIHFQGGAGLEANARGIPAISVLTPLTPNLPAYWKPILRLKRAIVSPWPGLSQEGSTKEVLRWLRDPLPSASQFAIRQFRDLLIGPMEPTEWMPPLQDLCKRVSRQCC